MVSTFGVRPWNAPEFHGKLEALHPLIDDSPMVGEITALSRRRANEFHGQALPKMGEQMVRRTTSQKCGVPALGT